MLVFYMEFRGILHTILGELANLIICFTGGTPFGSIKKRILP